MRIVKNLVLLYTLYTHSVQAQQAYPAAAVGNIEITRRYIAQTLHLSTGDDFYTVETDSAYTLRTQAGMYCYVYAAQQHRLAPVLDGPFKYFDTDYDAAKHYADSLQALHYDIMLYQTAGTSAAKLTARMLQYSNTSIAFIMLHEAIHRHRQNVQSALPYVFEEALGDVTANLCTGRVVNDENVKAYVACNEKMYALVNLVLNGKLSKKTCSKRLAKLLKNADAFQRDRFGYAVNNAFLLRYTSYCKYYFLLQQCMLRFKNPVDFYSWVFALQGSEDEIVNTLNDLVK